MRNIPQTILPKQQRRQPNSAIRHRRSRRSPPVYANQRQGNVVAPVLLPRDLTQLRTVQPNGRIALAVSQQVQRQIIAQRQRDDDDDDDNKSGTLRPVVCDGESLAWDDITQRFDAARIETGVRWFEAAGHRVVAVVPQDLRNKAENSWALDNLVNSGRLVVVECSGGNAEVNVPLERELLQKAVQEEAAVISEREFEQVYNENGGFRAVIEQRVVGFCFFKGSIFIPVDPYGRAGPWLNVILKK